MKKLVNAIIRKIKKEEYDLDKRIPSSYLFRLMFSRLMMAMRGGISGINTRVICLLRAMFTIKARRMFKAGRTVSIARGCFIDAFINGWSFRHPSTRSD